jgi:hypothetical protein
MQGPESVAELLQHYVTCLVQRAAAVGMWLSPSAFRTLSLRLQVLE